MKTAELSGEALDWAVAEAEGHDFPAADVFCGIFNPSTDWTQGRPIIEREGIETTRGGAYVEHFWKATRHSNAAYGPTPLIAAMRCYVASKLGDTVDIPAELGGEV
jgi:hypothetical protein